MNFIDGSMPSYGSEHLVDLRQRENEINEAADHLPSEGTDEPEDQAIQAKPFSLTGLFRRLWRGD